MEPEINTLGVAPKAFAVWIAGFFHISTTFLKIWLIAGGLVSEF